MSLKQPIVDKIMVLAATLSQKERHALVQRLMAMSDAETALPQSRPSLYGILTGLRLDEEEIETARQEMWAGFPRQDT